MKYRFFTADVFTDRVFGGNPLAVIPEAEGLSDDQMQHIAREFRLSETTFVFPPQSPEGTYHLRIFTPRHEVPFAGHPTVGTAYVLAASGIVPLKEPSTHIVLEEGVGNVPVEIRSDNGRPWFTQLTAAKLPEFGPPPPPSEHIAAMLSLDPEDVIDDDKDEPLAISCGVPFLFVPLRSIKAVRRARVNWEWYQQSLSAYWARLIYPFSYETETDDADVHARMFAMSSGYEEDPATGAAASALGGYLARRNGGGDGVRHWVVEQGFEIDRPSRIEVEAEVAGGQIRAIRVGGRSVMVSEGTIDVPA